MAKGWPASNSIRKFISPPRVCPVPLKTFYFCCVLEIALNPTCSPILLRVVKREGSLFLSNSSCDGRNDNSFLSLGDFSMKGGRRRWWKDYYILERASGLSRRRPPLPLTRSRGRPLALTVRVIAKIYIAGEDLEGEKPNRSSSVNFSAANRSQTRESFLWKLKLITFRQSCFLLSSLSFSFPLFYCSFTKKFLLPCLHLIARNSAVKGGRRVFFPFLEFYLWIIIA